MSCMRCGKETKEDQAFCDECLEEMEQYPIKPGTPIQLPLREDKPPVKRARFRLAESKWKDKIFLLKYIIVWLVIVIVLLAAALALCICMLLKITPDWINEFVLQTALLLT